MCVCVFLCVCYLCGESPYDFFRIIVLQPLLPHALYARTYYRA